MKQIVLALLANAGGVGKSTISTHIAYDVSKRGYTVAMLDLDPQRSLDVFCGLSPVEANLTTVELFSKDFKGDWSLVPVWDSKV
jgi:chromosome partitioning protein